MYTTKIASHSLGWYLRNCSFHRVATLLKSMSVVGNSPTIPLHLAFLKCGSCRHNGSSGAYLFPPDASAEPLTLSTPTVLLCQGALESTISAGLLFTVHKTILRGDTVEIRNAVDIANRGNTKIVMRISSNINSGPVFYTALNGLQVIKRNYFERLPLQAYNYPISARRIRQIEGN